MPKPEPISILEQLSYDWRSEELKRVVEIEPLFYFIHSQLNVFGIGYCFADNRSLYPPTEAEELPPANFWLIITCNTPFEDGDTRLYKEMTVASFCVPY